jgi:hypothetical protein
MNFKLDDVSKHHNHASSLDFAKNLEKAPINSNSNADPKSCITSNIPKNYECVKHWDFSCYLRLVDFIKSAVCTKRTLNLNYYVAVKVHLTL